MTQGIDMPPSSLPVKPLHLRLRNAAIALHSNALELGCEYSSVGRMLEEAANTIDSAKGHYVNTLPDNFLSHRDSWLKAFDRLIELEPESTEPDMDEKGFWRHERKAMLDMYADLDANCTPSELSQTVDKEKEELRSALEDLISWFDGGPSRWGPWIIDAGEYGADGAVKAARDVLSKEEKPIFISRAIDPQTANLFELPSLILKD